MLSPSICLTSSDQIVNKVFQCLFYSLPPTSWTQTPPIPYLVSLDCGQSLSSVLYFVLSPQPVLGFQQILRPVKSNCLFWLFSFGNKSLNSISDFTQQLALRDFQNWMKDMSCIPGGGQTYLLKVLLSRPNWSKLWNCANPTFSHGPMSVSLKYLSEDTTSISFLRI